jgi:hypothetical protein
MKEEEIGCKPPDYPWRKIKAKHPSFQAPLFIYGVDFILHTSYFR